MMIDINSLKFDEKGLIPAVVTDYYTKQVLTVAYMNKESLQKTIDTKLTCFYSRSRQQLWLKGETSGNYQHVVSITTDCDNEDEKAFAIDNLYQMLVGRKTDMPAGSYTTYLFEKGLDKILKKVGEECTEVIIGAKGGDKAETVYEICDLTYHVMVLMVEYGISLNEIRDELARRHIVDKKVKQEKMQ